VTKLELQKQLHDNYALLAKLQDRKARGENVRSSLRAVNTCIRYLKYRIREES
jgi:predicted DNA-binding ribbon-helix-helix protein